MQDGDRTALLDIYGDKHAFEEALDCGRSCWFDLIRNNGKRKSSAAADGRTSAPFRFGNGSYCGASVSNCQKLVSLCAINADYSGEPNKAKRRFTGDMNSYNLKRFGLNELQERRAYLFAKRAFDAAFSVAVLVVGFIPGVLLSIAVMRDTGGSPIYSQERVGKDGRLFDLYKFRTMVADADDVEKYFDEEQLAQWRLERKVYDDPRITPLGSFLRKSSIDEFPQFVNVFLGQMSVIGPRAITEDELKWFGDNAAEVLSVRPGVTGQWQVGLRNKATFESGVRQIIELDYVNKASVGLDAKIFFKTFEAMLMKTGC